VLATDYIKTKTKYFYACLPDKNGIYETRTGNSDHTYIFREYWAHLGKSSASSKSTAVKLAIRTAAAEIKTPEPTGPTDQTVSDPGSTLDSTLSEPIRASGATHLTYTLRLQIPPFDKTTKRDALVGIMELVAGSDNRFTDSATVDRAQAIVEFFQYEYESSNETANALNEALQVSLINTLALHRLIIKQYAYPGMFVGQHALSTPIVMRIYSALRSQPDINQHLALETFPTFIRFCHSRMIPRTTNNKRHRRRGRQC